MLAVMLLMLAPSGWGGGGCPNGQCGGPSYQIPFFMPQVQPIDEASINSLPPAKSRLVEVSAVEVEGTKKWIEFKGDKRKYVVTDKTKLRIDGKESYFGDVESEWNAAKLNNETKYFKAAGECDVIGSGDAVLRSLEFYYEHLPVPDTGPPKAAKDAGKGQGCPDCEHCECGCEDGKECKCKQPGAAWPDPITRNEGLILDKMPRHSEHVYWIHDGNKLKPVNRQQAFASLKGDGALPDDSKALRLSCIGTAEECATIEKDVTSNPAFSDLKGAFTFQSYRPDNAMVADIGVAPGKPAVYLQAPDGKVLQRWESYAGPEATASALRKKRPDYDPKKDPNGNEAGLFDLFNIKLKFPKFTIGNNPLMLLACVVAAAFVWKKL